MITNTKAKKAVVLLMLVLITVVLTMQAACTRKDAESITVTFTAVFYDGTTRTEQITTEKATLGEALEEKGFIESGDGFVTSVFGTNYDDLGTVFWMFYVGDEMPLYGVFDAELTDGATYTLKAEEPNW